MTKTKSWIFAVYIRKSYESDPEPRYFAAPSYKALMAEVDFIFQKYGLTWSEVTAIKKIGQLENHESWE
jgi:hypothetical protein